MSRQFDEWFERKEPLDRMPLPWWLTVLVVGLWAGLLIGCGMVLAGTAFAAEGLASYYTTQSCQSEGTSGIWTASGERFDESAMTCAVRSRAFGTEYLVFAPDTGKEVFVRQNDFGPGKGPTAKGVVIDLTPTAFEALGFTRKQGLGRVIVQRIK